MPKGGKLRWKIPVEHVPANLEAGGLSWQYINPRWAAWFILFYRKITRSGPPSRLGW